MIINTSKKIKRTTIVSKMKIIKRLIIKFVCKVELLKPEIRLVIICFRWINLLKRTVRQIIVRFVVKII